MNFKQKYLKMKARTNLSFAEIGRRCGVSNNSAWAWAHSREKPTLEHIKKLASVLNCSVDDLLDDEEKEQKEEIKINDVQSTNVLPANDFLIAMDALSYNLSESDKRTLLNIASSLIDARKDTNK